MKIVHVAPCHEIVPPLKDGGTERIVHELSEGLVHAGHEVILYAPPGSSSSGTLIPYPRPDMPEEEIARFVRRTLPQGTDLIHDHTFTSAIGKLKLSSVPVVCTLHLPNNNRISNPVYVSKRALEVIGRGKGHYVYNGLQISHYQYSEQKEDYLLFMGRIIREKGIAHALDIADQTGLPLVIAGPIHDPELFDQLVKPRIAQNRKIRYVGSVGGQEKQNLLKHAKCVLFPSIWEEPFGLVLVEAMACGSPVLAFKKGAAAEVLEGFPQLLCSSPDEMKAKLSAVSQYAQPAQLRQYVTERFTTNRMTENYIALYERLISSHKEEQARKTASRPKASSNKKQTTAVKRTTAVKQRGKQRSRLAK